MLKKFSFSLHTVFLFLLCFSAFGAEDYLKETVEHTIAVAFPLTPIRVSSFEWVPKEGQGLTPGNSSNKIRVTLVPSSLEWVRVTDELALPRAVTHVESDIPGAIEFLDRTFFLYLNPKTKKYTTDFLVPLVVDETMAWKFQPTDRGQHALSYFLTLKQNAPYSIFAVDPSCNPISLSVLVNKAAYPKGRTYFFSCRYAHQKPDDHRRLKVEIQVFSGKRSQSVTVNEQPILSSSSGTVNFMMDFQAPNSKWVEADGNTFEIRTRIPPEVHYLNLGVGLGPYIFSQADYSGGKTGRLAPLLTLYGSFFFTEASRLVMFSATKLGSDTISDNGLYVNNESLRIIDRRLSVHLMLGLNYFMLHTPDGYGGRLGFPQGVELVIHDTFPYHLTVQAGAFIYPNINGKSYYNSWLRFGGRSLFGELNYISIRDNFRSQTVSSKAIGVSVGMPLGHFL